VERVFQLTAFSASALGGAAGVLTGINFNAIHAFMGGPIMHRGIAVIILGGMGDIRGAVLGGLILGFAEIMSVAYLSSDYRTQFPSACCSSSCWSGRPVSSAVI